MVLLPPFCFPRAHPPCFRTGQFGIIHYARMHGLPHAPPYYITISGDFLLCTDRQPLPVLLRRCGVERYPLSRQDNRHAVSLSAQCVNDPSCIILVWIGSMFASSAPTFSPLVERERGACQRKAEGEMRDRHDGT